MAISRTQNVSAAATSVAITAATAGDYIVVFAFNGSSATACTLPAGFTNLVSAVSANSAARLYYKIAAGGETSSGVSTNATQIVCMVYRGASGFGTTPTIGTNTNTSLIYSAVTLLNTSGSSWVIGFGAGASMTAGMNGTPTGTAPNLGNRTSQTLCNGLDTGAGVTSFSAQTLTVTTTGRWQTVTIELKAPTVFTQGLTATSSPAAALTKFIKHPGLTATCSPVAALTRNLGKGLAAALSFVGNIATNLIHGGGTLFTQSLTATLSFVGNLASARSFFRSFSAILNPSAGGYPTSNLISYWKLDEASGTRVDSAGTNNLTDNNTVGSATGIIGNAASFVAASSQYLSCASNASLQMAGNTDFTISAWVKLASSISANASLVTKDSNAANSRDYTLDYLLGGGFRFYIQGGSTYIASTAAPAATLWYFLVAWYDSSNGQLHIRINDITTYDSATGATGTDVSAPEFRIGARERSIEPDYADAVIDEVGLWKRKLTAGEITALYNGGAGITYTGTPAATLSRRIARSLAATLSFTGLLTVSKAFLKAFTATLSFVGSIAVLKLFTRAFTATLSFTGAVTRRIGKALAATLSFLAALAKNIPKGLTATLSFAGALGRKIPRAFTATLSFAGNLSVSKSFIKAFTATLSFAGTLTTAAVHFFTRSFTATLSFAGNLTSSRMFARALTATLNATGALKRQIGKSLSAMLSFSTALRRTIRKGLGAVLSFVGFLFRGLPFRVYADTPTDSRLSVTVADTRLTVTLAASVLAVTQTSTTLNVTATDTNLRIDKTI